MNGIKHKYLDVELIFNDSSQQLFNFPIKNSIRISFWIEGACISSPSEISFYDTKINRNEKVNAKILIIDIFEQITEGAIFYISHLNYQTIRKGVKNEDC